jgi:hypothetical protein
MAAMRACLRLCEGSHCTLSKMGGIREILEFRKRMNGNAALWKGSESGSVEGGSLEDSAMWP